jgi:formate dehydrogenase (coenzyme F420) beta subunit
MATMTIKSGMLKVKDHNPEATLRTVLAGWLKQRKLTGLLVPAFSAGGSATMALVSEPDKLADVMPLQPAMAVNAASVVHDIAGTSAPGEKVGLLLRPCELRALVELVKLRQVLLDNLVLIGIDCPGTYKAAGFRDVRKNDADFDNKHVRDQKDYTAKVDFRTACQMCEYPKPLAFDLAIGWLGIDPDKELFFEAATEKGSALLEGLELAEAPEPEARKKYLAVLADKRRQKAQERIGELDKAMMGADNLVRYYADCLNCHNCMHVCPVCYCHECFFDSDTFSRGLGEHVRSSKRKGLTRMPSETLLFHITRMNHMMTSCVACGICEDSCPVTIGLATLFKKVSQNAQKEFDYVSGRSLEEPLPLTTFREDEFKKVGEE